MQISRVSFLELTPAKQEPPHQAMLAALSSVLKQWNVLGRPEGSKEVRFNLLLVVWVQEILARQLKAHSTSASRTSCTLKHLFRKLNFHSKYSPITMKTIISIACLVLLVGAVVEARPKRSIIVGAPLVASPVVASVPVVHSHSVVQTNPSSVVSWWASSCLCEINFLKESACLIKRSLTCYAN